MPLPGEGVEEWIREEVGDGKSAVLEGTEGHPQGCLELIARRLKVELICLQHEVGLEEALLMGRHSVFLLVECMF